MRVAEGEPSVVAEQALQPGVVVANNYRIVRQLGAGGFGTVFLAENITLAQKVVVKMLRGERGLGAEEARVLASLDAPNVVHVYAYDEKYDCIVMQFLAGESLLAQRHRLDIVAAVRVVYEAALALAAVHARGLVHRDVKPENIMAELKSGEVAWVKLIDLGTAMTIGRTTKFPSGTPHYCAPEQFDGSIGASPANDIYALGVTLFELCAQRLPFDLEDPVALGEAHTSASVPDLVQTRQAVRQTDSGPLSPEALDPAVEMFLDRVGELVMKMMAKQAAARPDAMTVARRLNELEREFSSEQTQVGFRLPAPIALVNQAKTSTMILTRGPSTKQALLAVDRSNKGLFAVLAVGVVLLGVLFGSLVTRPDAVVLIETPTPGIDAGVPVFAAEIPEALEPLLAIDAGLVMVRPVKVTPVKKVVQVAAACTFDDRFRDYARQVVSELRTVSGGGPRFDKLEDDVGAALVDRDCKRVNQALSGMRRVAGVQEDE